MGESAPESVVIQIRHRMGLDRPLPVQYLRYLERLVHGDVGTSKIYQQGAMDQIRARLPATLLLAAVAMAIAIAVGVPAGVVAALHPYSWLDTLSMVAAVCGVSLPSFWLGLMLIIAFAVTFRTFPVAGFPRAGRDRPPRGDACREPDGRHRARDPVEHARRAQPGLRADGPRQGAARARRDPSPRAAQRADPDPDRRRIAARLPARRLARRRDRLRLAWGG